MLSTFGAVEWAFIIAAVVWYVVTTPGKKRIL
jgi:hypothetical protein